jgi:hypothetical protein
VASIYTLLPDVQKLLTTKGWWSDEISSYFTNSISRKLRDAYSENERKSGLRLSRMGDSCPRQVWYSCHHPEYAEPLPSSAILKYTYGHIIEALALTLARAAGHQVEGEQDEITLDGVPGHRDCVIDGNIVDIKSSSTRSMAKFKDSRSFEEDDAFGYLDQIDGYVVGSSSDVVVLNKKSGFIWAIDKTLGNMVLYEHEARPSRIKERISLYRSYVGSSTPPPCNCGTRPYGGSGARALDIRASYSSYRHACFPNLRTVIEKGRPIYLTSDPHKSSEGETDASRTRTYVH